MISPRLLVSLLALALALTGCSRNVPESANAAAAKVPPLPLAMLPRDVVPMHYRLALTVDPEREGFTGHAETDVTFSKPLRAFFLHGQELQVGRVAVRTGSGLEVTGRYLQVHDSGIATVSFDQALRAGPATLVVDYRARFNRSLSGLYKVISRGDSYAFTQFENTDARRAFPSFDEPGFKTPFDVTIIAPSADKVIANTPVLSRTEQGSMTKWVFEPTKPLPTYLIALAVGPLDLVDAGDVPPNQYRRYPVHLRGVAARGLGPKLKYALSLTPAVVTALENYYHTGYPFQKLDTLAVPDFSAGAMENAGAITYREQLLLMDDNAPLEQRRQSLTVQAHEIAHQWFGDLVTPRWWDDIWLNESFATWMEYKAAQAVRPDQDYARDTLIGSLGVMRLDELPSARRIHNPVNTPDDIDNAFDDITYSKGSAVLSMFESFVGPQEFQKGIHAYLTKYSYGTATAEDFIGTIAQVTGHPEIVLAFRNFIDQPHIPLLETKAACTGAGTSLDVRETVYRPIGVILPEQHWHVPVCIEGGGNKLCRLSNPRGIQLTLPGTCAADLFPNVGGAGYYRFTVPEDHWQTLLHSAPSLSAADQLTLFHSVNAAVRAGLAPAADLYAVIAQLAPASDWSLLYTDRHSTFDLIDALHDLRVTGVLTAGGLAAQQQFVRRYFGPRLRQLGLLAREGEPASDAMLRAQLAQLLIDEGRDPAVIAPLAKAARAYLESAGKQRSLPPELRQQALRAGVIAEGAPFENLLIEAMQKSDDEYFIQSAIYALAGAEDRGTLDHVLALALTPQIRTGDLRYVQRYFGAEPSAKQALWAWFQANFPAIERRLSRYGMGATPDIQKFGCDEASKAGLHNFFGPKLRELEGVPRVLQENEERIGRCMAFKAAKGAELNAAVMAAR